MSVYLYRLEGKHGEIRTGTIVAKTGKEGEEVVKKDDKVLPWIESADFISSKVNPSAISEHIVNYSNHEVLKHYKAMLQTLTGEYPEEQWDTDHKEIGEAIRFIGGKIEDYL